MPGNNGSRRLAVGGYRRFRSVRSAAVRHARWNVWFRHLTAGFRPPPPGFSLLETVIAVGIFVIVVTTVVNLYLFYSQAQRISGQRQRLVSEAGLLLDQMAQEIRTLELVYAGDVNYNNTGPPEVVYQVDVAGPRGASEGGPYQSDMVERERELVLQDNRGNVDPRDDTVIAYVFNRRDDASVADLCANEDGTLVYPGTVGLFRFVRDGTGPVRCQRLFNPQGLEVSEVGFFLTQPVNPYPDAVDPATDVRPGFGAGLDADCGPPGSSSRFNGYVCTCRVAGDCFSNQCEAATGGRCAYGPNRQPAVTIALTVRDQASPNNPLTLQTTVTQRRYGR